MRCISIYSYLKYFVMNLFKKAIQLGLDASSSAIQELNTFMDKFIKKHSLKGAINQ